MPPHLNPFDIFKITTALGAFHTHGGKFSKGGVKKLHKEFQQRPPLFFEQQRRCKEYHEHTTKILYGAGHGADKIKAANPTPGKAQGNAAEGHHRGGKDIIS